MCNIQVVDLKDLKFCSNILWKIKLVELTKYVLLLNKSFTLSPVILFWRLILNLKKMRNKILNWYLLSSENVEPTLAQNPFLTFIKALLLISIIKDYWNLSCSNKYISITLWKLKNPSLSFYSKILAIGFWKIKEKICNISMCMFSLCIDLLYILKPKKLKIFKNVLLLYRNKK